MKLPDFKMDPSSGSGLDFVWGSGLTHYFVNELGVTIFQGEEHLKEWGNGFSNYPIRTILVPMREPRHVPQ